MVFATTICPFLRREVIPRTLTLTGPCRSKLLTRTLPSRAWSSVRLPYLSKGGVATSPTPRISRWLVTLDPPSLLTPVGETTTARILWLPSILTSALLPGNIPIFTTIPPTSLGLLVTNLCRWQRPCRPICNVPVTPILVLPVLQTNIPVSRALLKPSVLKKAPITIWEYVTTVKSTTQDTNSMSIGVRPNLKQSLARMSATTSSVHDIANDIKTCTTLIKEEKCSIPEHAWKIWKKTRPIVIAYKTAPLTADDLRKTSSKLHWRVQVNRSDTMTTNILTNRTAYTGSIPVERH